MLLGGCAALEGDPASEKPADGRPASPPAGGAVAALAELSVKESAGKEGYDRRKFGSPWADIDGNRCSTRNDILQRDLDDVKLAEDGCTVESGTLTDDPYTGTTMEFTRGRSKVDIDHVVALSDSWQKGAADWAPAKRIALANDPLNLLAVEASANRQKGDSDAAEWLPANESYRCEYVALQIAVKQKYELWVTPAEKQAMSGVLDGCADQRLPEPGDAPTEAPDRFSAPE
ncbi:HNH endonuclease [Streptomyces durbertensis]|uniref:HNH endonuclease n=1 Tax=Streptomyces durbertensis TaxID=2448886 RepID=A0ABR6EED6_9ACTN|nr:HNH endonuclease [Streptomyces durbertensis]